MVAAEALRQQTLHTTIVAVKSMYSYRRAAPLVKLPIISPSDAVANSSTTQLAGRDEPPMLTIRYCTCIRAYSTYQYSIKFRTVQYHTSTTVYSIQISTHG